MQEKSADHSDGLLTEGDTDFQILAFRVEIFSDELSKRCRKAVQTLF